MTQDNDDSKNGHQSAARDEAEQIATRARRKREARGREVHSPLFGIGMFGLVGWAVALPTVLGVALGLWIDGRWPSDTSWTLVLLLAGVTLGALNAWYWVERESRDDD